MWGKIDVGTKDRLEKEYQKNKEVAAKDKANYVAKYGKIQRKKKNKRAKKQ